MQTQLQQIKRDHVAIMNKSWKLIPKILSFEKTIESRWYMNKIAPWDKISVDDTIYFKDSGAPVTAKATVSKVLQFDNLDDNKIEMIIKEYNFGIRLINIDYSTWGKLPRYCILVFLKDAVEIKTSFKINKKGFGSAAAWLTVNSINEVKL